MSHVTPSSVPDADTCCGPVADAPIACSLTGADVTDRIADWEALLDGVVDREPVEGGVRLAFADADVLPEVARLAGAEQACCPFFSFAITVDGRGVALEVRAPADGQDVLTTLFGPA